jgi:hypothetical protein
LQFKESEVYVGGGILCLSKIKVGKRQAREKFKLKNWGKFCVLKKEFGKGEAGGGNVFVWESN